MTTPREHFDTIVDGQLDHAGVSTGRMFSAYGLRTGTRFFAFLMREEHLVVKIPRERVNQLVADGLATHFEPGPGRPMKEWAALPYSDEDDPTWAPLVEEAREFVQSLTGDREQP